MGSFALLPLGLTICLLMITTTIANHWCEVQGTRKEQVERKCANIFDIIMDKEMVFKRKINQTVGQEYQLCSFEKTIPTKITQCCGGWMGSNCDQAYCKPSCQNGGVCQGPDNEWEYISRCECSGTWRGRDCGENKDAVENGNMLYCYEGNQCQGQKISQDTMAITDCCSTDNINRAWGSDYLKKCTPCNITSTIKVNPDRTFATCMTSGDDMYRTFDNVVFPYYTLCSVGLIESNLINIYARTECEGGNQCSCYKVVTIEYVPYTYTLDGTMFSTKKDGEDEVKTYNLTSLVLDEAWAVDNSGGVVLKNSRNAVYMEFFGLDMSLRLDEDGTFSITLKTDYTRLSNLNGVCGNFNGDPNDELNRLTQIGAQMVFDKYTNKNLPCGTGLTKCVVDSADYAEAKDMCNPLITVLFGCHGVVPVQNYLDRCFNSYCTFKHEGPEAAKKAVCNVLSAYHSLCFQETNQATVWRTKDRCPMDCAHPYEFNPVINTKCAPKCGMPKSAYLQTTCKMQPYAGCQCKSGYARINGTCVPASKCQCEGGDGKFYDIGESLTSNDHCLECACGQMGVWNCQAISERCSGSCKIINNRMVTTFDGTTYTMENTCGELTLVTGNEFADPDKPVQILMEAKTCLQEDSGEQFCPVTFKISFRKQTAEMSLTNEGLKTENEFTPYFYIRKLGANTFSADIMGGLIRLIVSKSGVVEIKMNAMGFKHQIHGLCGSYDGKKDNDFQAPTLSQVDATQFSDIFSSCTDPETIITMVESTVEVEVCRKMNTVPLPTSSRVNRDDYVKMCEHATDFGQRCNIFLAFSYEAEVDMNLMFPSLQSCFQACDRKRIEICNSNCKDFMYAKCDVDIVYDCGGCNNGEYMDNNGVCVPEDSCGCYDFLTPKDYIEEGATYITGCKNCKCEKHNLTCQDSCEQVICPNTHVSKKDILESGTTDCQSKMCPKPYYISPVCLDAEQSSQFCFCAEGWFQTQDGMCVQKCPCYDSGRWYVHGQGYEMNCQTFVCEHGSFKVTETNDCSGVCVLTGSDLKIKQFDKTTLNPSAIRSQCSLTAFEYGQFSVVFKPTPCGSSGAVCLYIIDIKTAYMPGKLITLKTTAPNSVWVGDKQFFNTIGNSIRIVDTNFYLNIFIGDLFVVQWNRGLTIRIEASSKLMGQTSGMCGNFNGDDADDNAGRDTALKSPMSSFVDSWKEPAECQIGVIEPNVDICKQDSLRKTWAEAKCGIIMSTDGPFAPCHKGNTHHEHYLNCVNQACNCDTGGDCECLCDAIAVYASLCAQQGVPVRWRHQRLCPMQCDYGAVYQPCGNACPKACGTAGNDSNAICDSLSCQEGCFCPENYVRSNLNNMAESVCVPVSECPCEDEYHRTIYPDNAITIDCQKCECKNGSMECTGNKCSKRCDANMFTCTDNRCIDHKLLCNGIPNCMDGSDEFSCIDTHCKGFLCDDGLCVGNTTVCDGKRDCMDNSDEANCNTTCLNGLEKCWKSGSCIPKHYFCDGNVDCWYGEDEDLERCIICPKNETHCNRTVCIPKNYFCDGHDDCGDGSDEVGCSTPFTTPTPFVCAHDSKTINNGDVAGLNIDAQIGHVLNIFTADGWKGTNPQSRVTISLDSLVPSVLESISFEIKNSTGSNVQLYINAGPTTDTETLSVLSPSQTVNKVLNKEFVTIWIETEATITNLVIHVCYKPLETTTPTVTTTTEKKM